MDAKRTVGWAGRVVAGTAGLAVRTLRDVAGSGPDGVSPRPDGVSLRPDRTPDGRTAPPPPPPAETIAVARLAAVRLGEAALGLAAVTVRRTLDVASAAAMPIEAAATIIVRTGTSVAGRSATAGRIAGRIDRLARIGREEQRRNEREAALLLRSAWRRSVARVVAETDVDAVVGQVDLDAVVDRIDIDAVVARLDIPTLVERVLDDIDLGRIVRESSTGMAAETVGAVRSRSAGADRAINGFVDRVVLRRPPRDGAAPP
jgi:hypothetical protein